MSQTDFAHTTNSAYQVRSHPLLRDQPVLGKELKLTTVLPGNYVQMISLPFYQEAHHANQ